MSFRVIVVILVGSLFALSCAQSYQTITISLRQLETYQSEYVRLTGYFETDKSFSSRVDGTLRLGSDVLSVRGGVFDWLPQDETWVVMWGELRSENGEPYLAFHNGHPLTKTRAPRPAASTEGERADVWLKVSIGGAKPNTFYQGLSEDRQSFVLQNYKGDLGLQCVNGVVGRMSGRRVLTDIQPCTPN